MSKLVYSPISHILLVISNPNLYCLHQCAYTFLPPPAPVPPGAYSICFTPIDTMNVPGVKVEPVIPEEPRSIPLGECENEKDSIKAREDQITPVDSTGFMSCRVQSGESRSSRIRELLGRVFQGFDSGSCASTGDLSTSAGTRMEVMTLPPRASGEQRTIVRVRPTFLTDQDINRLRQHRRKARQDRRGMCWTCLIPARKLPARPSSNPSIECGDTPVPGYRAEPPIDRHYIRVEGLNTPRSPRSVIGQGHINLLSEAGFYHRPDLHAFPYQTAQVPGGRARVKLPLLRSNYTTDEPVIDSYRILLTHMSANLNNKLHGDEAAGGSPMRLKLFPMEPIEEIVSGDTHYTGLSVVPSSSSALVKRCTGGIGLSVNKVRFKPMISFEYAGPAFNQQLVAILWYLFEEYMMFPSMKSQMGERKETGNNFLKVNYAFWEYVGALLNTLVHREWLFDYVEVLLAEFPKLALQVQRSSENLTENGKAQVQVDALRAIRTCCYLICKLFDSKHDWGEVSRFHKNGPVGLSCFGRLIEISKEEEGIGPAARLAVTYVFSRIRVCREMIRALVRTREVDADYFRVHRIPLRCCMMIWLKLVTLQEKKEEVEDGEGEEWDMEEEEEAKRLAMNEVMTLISLEHNTTIRTLYFQLFPDLNTK